MARLGDVFPLIRNGVSIKQIDGAGGLPITRIETIANRVVDRSRMGYANIIDNDRYAEYQLQDGDILMSHINSEKHLGKVARYKSNANEYIIHGMNLLVLRVDRQIMMSEYAEYFFNSDSFLRQIPNITKKSVNQASFNISSLRELFIPIPQLDQQREVVHILDGVCALISLRKQQLAKLDELVKARFVELFGDPIDNPKGLPVKTLKELSTLITNGNTPKGGSENYVDKGILFLRSQNVWRNRIELDDVAYIDEATHHSLKKSSLKHKDILITKTGRINTENSSLGRAALYLGEDDSANINGHVYLIRLDGSVVPEYVVTILTSEAYRKYIRKVCVGGIDKRQINLDQVEDFPIILPSVDLQEQFAAFVEQTDKSKLAVQQSIDQLETLKKSLMQKYFG